MSGFRGKTTLITGAARGIGRRMALGVASRGGRVVSWDLDAAALQALMAELPGAGHTSDVVDVTDRALVREAARRAGTVDVLINNAGVVSGRRLLDIPDEKIARTFEVNALALFWTTRAFLPGMLERGTGHVVTVASAAGLVGTSGLVDYSASKFAAVGFDEALRMELARTAPGVRTTVVCPYYIDTGMFDGARTRFSVLLPILQEADVAERILRAVEGNRRRLVLPAFLKLLPLIRLLPLRPFDLLMDVLGISRSMDHFTGRRA